MTNALYRLRERLLPLRCVLVGHACVPYLRGRAWLLVCLWCGKEVDVSYWKEQ